MLWRLQRAMPAKAVLLARRASDGRILLASSPAGGMRLPAKPLDARTPIAIQVEAWVSGMLREAREPVLIASGGPPETDGVVFLYEVLAVGAESEDGLWLDPVEALERLDAEDRRLLALLRPAEARLREERSGT